MIKIDKVYTKGGDKGKTSLGNGERVDKSSTRVEAFGTVDEANAILGLLKMEITSVHKKTINRIQNDLFDLGADLCIPEAKSLKYPPLRISEKHVELLERDIDLINKNLDPLESFVLPGGSYTSSYVHLARTVVRRAERRIIELAKKENINPITIKYINRLSDLLFVLARIENKEKNIEDILWKPSTTE